MQIKTVFIASAAFALASAKVILTNVVYSTITAGKPFTFTWADAEGPVALILRGAQPGAAVTDPNNLAEIYTIESNLSGESYVWNVPANIVQSTYAIEIRDSEDNNYGALFEVIGGVKTTTLQTASRTASGSSTGTATESSTSTGTESAETETATGSTTGTRTAASTSASRTASATPSASGTSAPAGGMASGLTSNLALVFVAVGALFMLN